MRPRVFNSSLQPWPCLPHSLLQALPIMLQANLDGRSGTGTALVGGPFTLTDQTGARSPTRIFSGKYMLVFFGYTYCPDLCPTELQVMSAALDSLGAKADAIQPVFISFDPRARHAGSFEAVCFKLPSPPRGPDRHTGGNCGRSQGLPGLLQQGSRTVPGPIPI